MKTTNLSKPYFFAASTTEKPGKIVAQFVRLETIEFDPENFDQTQFDVWGCDADKEKRQAILLLASAKTVVANLDVPNIYRGK